MLSQLRQAFSVFIFLVIITGIIYPLLTTLVGQTLFPSQANGSLVQKNDQIIGSSLLGQNFNDAKYFWGRLSATTPYPYNTAASSGLNLAATNPALISALNARVQALHAADKTNFRLIPVDLVTSSASGLDPDISLAAAFYQASRIANVRHLPLEKIDQLIIQSAQAPLLGFIGESRVNVLKLNLALDEKI